MRRAISLLAGILALSYPAQAQTDGPWQQVEVVRTAHGVPHIRADNMRAAAYALAWLQLEDHGPRTAMNVLAARAGKAMVFGRDSIDDDFLAHPRRLRAQATYHLLEQDTRDYYEGFAAGVNRYIELHPEQFPARMPRDFTGYDVATLDVAGPALQVARQFLAARAPRADSARAAGVPARDPEEGSNAWAFAPSRTKSGRAILLRNPHLAWTAGYYEAHMTVPGRLDFYGDFRIGGPFGVIGGFNKDLGWSTTNNAQDREEVYALEADTLTPDHYRLDGASLPLTRELVTIPFRNGGAIGTETRETWSTPLGPVIHRADGRIYILRTTGDGEYRAGEQFLRMMRATSLAEWKDAMRMRARVTSNFTYADRAGNILYLWNAALPVLPHPVVDDTVAIPVRTMRDMWTRYVPFDSLPQVLNPRGGYVHNENDSHHFTNMRMRVDTTNAYPNFERPELLLRSQHAIALIDNNTKLSLEDVVRLKHSYRMLLADRVKDDLIRMAEAAHRNYMYAPTAVLRRWDNTAAPESVGGTLFEMWWQRYSRGLPDSLRFARPWTARDPLRTPAGIRDSARAVAALDDAARDMLRVHGRVDVPWGEVHRLRRGNVDVPIGGCPGALGCFRVIGYTRADDGKLVATTGDGWVLAVEFTDVPRAYSVLAYGQSPRPDSPWHADQAEMFARGEMKRVAFTARDVDAGAVQRFRPGAPR